MLTNTDVLARHGYTTDRLEHPDLHIPVLTGIQRQGDVLILPSSPPRTSGGRPLGAGVEVVRAEAGGNTHTLHGDGRWLLNAEAADGLTQGWLAVPDGGTAWLIHTEEHSALGIGPGVYEIRRQREFAGEWRQVAD